MLSARELDRPVRDARTAAKSTWTRSVENRMPTSFVQRFEVLLRRARQ